MKKLIMITILYFTICLFITNWYETDIVDFQLEQACNSFDNSNEYQFDEQWGTNWERCTLIWQAQYRFENVSKPYLDVNNIFWFRRHWIVEFNSVEDGVIFYANRYFKYEYRKTISQIVAWWCYYNLSNNWVCFSWYTLTKAHQYSYSWFIKRYFILNMNK